tara:strand:- start:1234 stop:1647 length:414 start_codon:yes stop_codon:yes gene_type:complete
MKQVNKFVQITTIRKLTDITNKINDFVKFSNISNGIINLSIVHTSASLIVQENADSDVLKDIEIFFDKLVPQDNSYNHSSEGIDDMPAHIKASLTQNQLTFSIIDGNMILGVWQGIFLFEHRTETKRRRIFCHIIGD